MNVLERLLEILRYPVITLGQTALTPWTLIYLIVLIVLLFAVVNRVRDWLVNRMLARRGLDRGVRAAIGSLARYVMLIIGFIAILQSVGIDLSTLTIFAGAVGIGVGFGLQNIASNFVSGLIILLDRPIKVGDRIEVGNVLGDVVSISARATTVLTNDNIAFIVPNSSFVSETVTNWSYPTSEVRFGTKVGVAYGSDPEKVRDVLLSVARAHPGVLKQPAPDVLFTEFGDSSLNFELRVWTREYTGTPRVLRSELNFGISKALAQSGVEIPFPQRDVHIRSGSLGIRRVRDQDGG